MDRIDKESWLKKWRDKGSSKPVEEETLSNTNKIFRLLEIIGALILALGAYILIMRIRGALYAALILILSGGLLLGVTIIIRGVLKRGVIFLKDIASTIVLWSIGILMIAAGFSSIPDSMSGYVTFAGTIAAIDMILGSIIVLFATKGFDDAIRYNSKKKLTLSQENVPYLYHLIVLLGFIVSALIRWNIILFYAGFFLIIGGSLAMLITVFLAGFSKMGADFLNKENHLDAVVLLIGLSMVLGALLWIRDWNATINPGYDAIISIVLVFGLLIILFGNLLMEIKFTGLIVKQEIYTEKDRPKRFLSQLRATRKHEEEIKQSR